jgi:hypothetical protein
MTIYNVHIYREMRLFFADIEADTSEHAATIARDKPTDEANSIDDCEGETLAALVDLVGNEEYGQSRVIDFEPERQAAPALLAALKDLLGDQPGVREYQCQWCGRDYRDDDPDLDMRTGDCSFDECPSFIARAAIAKTTGEMSSGSHRTLTIEVRGGVVQDVSNVPPGWDYEIIDHDNAE